LEPENNHKYRVAVVGAGPAGLYAAKQLACEGVHVTIFNRDIKPGGLAEYGIYFDKYRMKDGLRVQFKQILASPDIEYYGNVLIGKTGDITLDELKQMGFQAILVTAGAQGTKWLGLPGEYLVGVYHSKDIVYHYNQLPPYGQKHFRIGKRVAVIGVGNVMLDIVHWLVHVKKVDEVMAIARRGPGEVKFTKVELGYVVAHIDRQFLQEEVTRLTPLMQTLGQDTSVLPNLVEELLTRSDPPHSPTVFKLLFCESPTRIIGENGRVVGLEMEDNTLIKQEVGEPKPRGLGTKRIIDVDTVIFAIGDQVDESLGLPFASNVFLINPEPRFPVEGISYEIYDPQVCCPWEGVFVAGWSRKASTGLVGIARKDGTNGAKAVMSYLQTLPAPNGSAATAVLDCLHQIGKPVVTKPDLERLSAVENQEAIAHGKPEFKFSSNEEMLIAMGLAEKLIED
jgi:ferredoxin/flavodoxin---NADP+ reductase